MRSTGAGRRPVKVRAGGLWKPAARNWSGRKPTGDGWAAMRSSFPAQAGILANILANILAHPAEACRLPHEESAARLVNCHLHVDVEAWRMRELLRRLPGQRQAAGDPTQSAAYRASWTAVAAGASADLGDHRKRRAQAWRAFLAAASLYFRLRADLDRSSAIVPRARAAA